jgi:hypothetical protein
MPSTTPGPDQGNMVNKNGALKMHGSKHPLKMYDKGSAAKMNSEFKYTPIQTDATGKRAGDSPMNMYGKSPAKMGNKSPLEANTNPSGKNKSRQTYSATLTTKPKPEVKAKKEKTNSGPTQQASSVQAMKNAVINSGMKPRMAKQIEAMTSMRDVKDAADKAGVSSNLKDYINYKSK